MGCRLNKLLCKGRTGDLEGPTRCFYIVEVNTVIFWDHTEKRYLSQNNGRRFH